MPLFNPTSTLALGSGEVATTPGALSGAGAGTNAADTLHTHQSPGGLASITANQSTGASTTEKQIVGFTIPANFMLAGTTFRIHAFGKMTVSGSGTAVTFRIRIGSTTLTGNIPVSIALTDGAITTGEFVVDALVTVRTNGAAGTVTGSMIIFQDTAKAPFTPGNATFIDAIDGATVAVDTTATKTVEFTIQTANAGNTAVVYVATIEVVKM